MMHDKTYRDKINRDHNTVKVANGFVVKKVKKSSPYPLLIYNRDGKVNMKSEKKLWPLMFAGDDMCFVVNPRPQIEMNFARWINSMEKIGMKVSSSRQSIGV